MNEVLQSVVASAGGVTAAAHGWILVPTSAGLEVAAATDAAGLVGQVVPAEGSTAGYVVASGQPVAMVPRPGDPAASAGVPAVLGLQPVSVLCVPCVHDDGVVAVLELVDKAGGGSFTFDDVELATVLAGIAGAAVASGTGASPVPTPDQLAAELRGLADADPVAYGAVARAIEAILSRG
ncbi:MAG: GAF domain-containing protein [Acidimicrobiales bacterium]